MKGNISREINLLDSSLKKIDGMLLKSDEFLLPKEDSNRTLLLITKQKPTSKRYPRNPKEIKNKPL